MNYHLIELANGTLAVMYTWMFYFGFLHVARCYRSARSALSGTATVPRAIKHLYKNNKPEIALLFIVGNLMIRTWALWYLRFVDNRNFTGWKLLTEAGTEVIVTSTLGVTLGVMCWIRVISPYKHRSSVVWTLMVVIALAFGFGSALYP